MGNELVALKEQLKKELAQVKERVEPPVGTRISTKGRVFTFPDGKTSPGPIDVVILDWRMINAYYKGVYDPQNVQPPVCWAISQTKDEMKPNGVAEPQSEACAECALNKFGSSPTGKGKACRNKRRLAVVPPDADVNTQPYILEVSPTGLKYFDSYVQQLASEFGVLPIQVITRVGFQPNAAYPSLIFGKGEILDEGVLPTMFKLRQAAQPFLDAPPSGN